MTGFQAGISNFNESESQILAVSTDLLPTLNHWAGELKAEFPMLSDHKREVSKLYGVLNPNSYVANRVSFVIDKEGTIVQVFESGEAMDVTGALTACQRIKKKAN